MYYKIKIWGFLTFPLPFWLCFCLQKNIFHALFVYALPNLIFNEAQLTAKPTSFEFILQISGFEKYIVKWRQMLILISAKEK